jgi:hypothetical protein
MLQINPKKVRHLIQQARLFDAKEEVSDPDSGSNGADDMMADVLEDSADDATHDEMMEFIRSLDEEEQIDVVALAWLGRGTYDVAEWEQAVAEAKRAHNRRTAEYLTSLPMLGDYLEEGLAMMEDAGQVDLEDVEES